MVMRTHFFARACGIALSSVLVNAQLGDPLDLRANPPPVDASPASFRSFPMPSHAERQTPSLVLTLVDLDRPDYPMGSRLVYRVTIRNSGTQSICPALGSGLAACRCRPESTLGGHFKSGQLWTVRNRPFPAWRPETDYVRS